MSDRCRAAAALIFAVLVGLSLSTPIQAEPQPGKQADLPRGVGGEKVRKVIQPLRVVKVYRSAPVRHANHVIVHREHHYDNHPALDASKHDNRAYVVRNEAARDGSLRRYNSPGPASEYADTDRYDADDERTGYDDRDVRSGSSGSVRGAVHYDQAVYYTRRYYLEPVYSDPGYYRHGYDYRPYYRHYRNRSYYDHGYRVNFGFHHHRHHFRHGFHLHHGHHGLSIGFHFRF